MVECVGFLGKIVVVDFVICMIMVLDFEVVGFLMVLVVFYWFL